MRAALIALLLWLLAPLSMEAAVAFVQSTSGSSASAGTSFTTPALTTTSGNFIAICVGHYSATSGSTVTVTDAKGNTYSSVTRAFDSGNQNMAQIFYAPNIVGGSSHTFTVATSVSTVVRVAVHEYSGVATSSPLDQQAHNDKDATTTSYTSTATATTTQADEVAIGCAYDGGTGNATLTPNGSWTARVSIRPTGSAEVLRSQDQILSATGTIAATGTAATGSSSGRNVVVATFKSATGGGAAPSIKRRIAWQ